MTKAHSEVPDNGGRCSSCNLPESAYMSQSPVPVYLGGGLGWGTMWMCPACQAKRKERDRQREEDLAQNRMG